jgi:hypothetical protein
MSELGYRINDADEHYYEPDDVVAGSDYPHPEGLADPAEFAAEIEALAPASRRLVLRDNFRKGSGL